jgi:hypothetical protein
MSCCLWYRRSATNEARWEEVLVPLRSLWTDWETTDALRSLTREYNGESRAMDMKSQRISE